MSWSAGPNRFAREFKRHVGLRLSHVCLVAAALFAMYLATESNAENGEYATGSSAQSLNFDRQGSAQRYY